MLQAESQSALSCKREQGSSFLLPDLNMPLDTDTSPWAYYSLVFPITLKPLYLLPTNMFFNCNYMSMNNVDYC